jgi:hypothetical protein
MRGEFIAVWPETWRDIWLPLSDQSIGDDEASAPADLFGELFREFAKALREPLTPGQLADIVDDPARSRAAFEASSSKQIVGESALVGFLEDAFYALQELEESAADALTNRYFNLLGAFIEKFSLRYDLRRPCSLCPTLPGVFSTLVRDVRRLADADPHLNSLMRDFDSAVRDLKQDNSDGRIKTCIQKQVNLLEAIGRTHPSVSGTTLGAIAEQLDTWPHERVKLAMKELYRFASDYPGIRHGGTPGNALRAVSMRDMVAVSILFFGFSPYLTDQLDAGLVYGGS